MYSVRSEQHLGNNYFGGFGDTVATAKEDFLESIDECRQSAISDDCTIPENFTVEFRYDIPSFFENFDFINASRFARLAGINESKMRQYKSGTAFPGEKTTKKILDAVHRIGAELSSVSL